MDDKQLERVRDYALGGGIEGDGHPLNPLDADLAAMRTPITAETLRAVGSWTHESTGLYRHDRVNVGDEFPTARLFVDFCDDDPPGVYIGEFRLPNVRTMYDLRELVRLLGGAA